LLGKRVRESIFNVNEMTEITLFFYFVLDFWLDQDISFGIGWFKIVFSYKGKLTCALKARVNVLKY
jgi:hypothetical protein